MASDSRATCLPPCRPPWRVCEAEDKHGNVNGRLLVTCVDYPGYHGYHVDDVFDPTRSAPAGLSLVLALSRALSSLSLSLFSLPPTSLAHTPSFRFGVHHGQP